MLSKIVKSPASRAVLSLLSAVYILLFGYFLVNGPIDATLFGFIRVLVADLDAPLWQFTVIFGLLLVSTRLESAEKARSVFLFFWVFAALVMFMAYVATALGGGAPLKEFGPELVYKPGLMITTGYAAGAYAVFLIGLLLFKRDWLNPSAHPGFFALFVVFFPAYLIYMANGYTVFGGDTTYNIYLPQRLLAGEGFYFDGRFIAEHGSWGLLKVDGGYMPVWPIGAAFFAIPTTLIQILLGVDPGHTSAALSQKMTSAWVAGAAAAVMFQIIHIVTRRPWMSALLTAGFALGTTQATISSVTLWQHGPTTLLILLGMRSILASERGRYFYLGLAGLPLAFLPVVRIQTVLFYFAGLAAVWRMRPRSVITFLLWSVPGVALSLYVNLGLYGHILGGYAHLAKTGDFESSFINGFAGLLISPNRGLFVFSPFLVLALFGAGAAVRNRSVSAISFGVAALVYTVLHAKWGEWYAGWCIGPRFTTEIQPVLMYLIAILFATRWKAALDWAVAALITVSIAITLPGMLYPHEHGWWNAFPDVNKNRERLWDFSDWLPLYFLHRLEFENFKEAPARAFVENQGLWYEKSDEYGYRVVIALKRKPQRLFTFPQVYLEKGEYELVLKGESDAERGVVYFFINVMDQRIVKPELEIPPQGPFSLSVKFKVDRPAYIDANTHAAGKGKAVFDSVRLRRL